jgi:hypothetical protein
MTGWLVWVGASLAATSDHADASEGPDAAPAAVDVAEVDRPVHGTAALQLGTVAMLGVSASVAWDPAHLAAEVGTGSGLYGNTSSHLRVGATFEVFDTGATELRYIGTRNSAGVVIDHELAGTATASVELTRWLGRAGLVGRLSGGALFSTTDVYPLPEVGLAVGVAF